MNRKQIDLFIVSFLALFLEVVFIRWVPSYERVLAYFTNFVLIAAFLGLGLGSMLTRWRWDLIRMQPLLILGLVVVCVFFNRSVVTRGSNSDVFYSDFGRGAQFELKLEQCLVFFFVLIAVEFIPLGQKIGKDFKLITPSLRGYIINILGSIAGVLVFALVSFCQLAPAWWFAVALALALWFVRVELWWKWFNIVAAVLTVGLVAQAGRGFFWSPYHKLVTSPLVVERGTGLLQPYKQGMDPRSIDVLGDSTGFHIAVDDDFLQMALNLSAASVEMHPFLTNYRKNYDLPYGLPNFPYDDVLIVGAGTGNDTAAALRRGAKHVDAVEIDPAIVQLGRLRHPERPYADERVQVFVGDARSYFNKTSRRYNLVVFGLLDSHRLFSSMSSVRLDSFVFTMESFQEVRRLLKDDGIVVIQHGLGAPFMRDRIYAMLTKAFEMPPAVLQVKEFPGLTFVTGPGIAKYVGTPRALDPRPEAFATDDWPFFYLGGHALPREYLTALVVMALISLLGVAGCAGEKLRSVDTHFFFLGSAFLLIETCSVTRFALLFGSTWAVNSIVFTAILLVVLIANLWMARLESVDTNVLYLFLAAAVVLNFLFPIHSLLRVGLPMRLLTAMTLMAAPIFFAAFIFARSFKQTPYPDLAYASNLLGAVVGGLTEYSTLVVGFRVQLLIALAMYGLSFVALRWTQTRGSIVAS